MAVALLVKPGDDLMGLVINSMRNDILGHLHHGKTLALSAIANIGGDEVAESLIADVQKLFIQTIETPPSYNNNELSAEQEVKDKNLIYKKCCLCLLRLFRSSPDSISIDQWPDRMIKLLEDRDLGVVTSSVSLLITFAQHSPSKFEKLVPYAVSILSRLVLNCGSFPCPPDYLYYRTPSPWLQVKLIRFFQLFGMPDIKNEYCRLLCEVLTEVLTKTIISDSVNKSNADNSILFEAVTLVILWGDSCPVELKEHATNLLGRFIAVKDANIRYLGLDSMTRLAKLEGPAAVNMHLEAALESLKDTDLSIRKRSLDLLYAMSDSSNATRTVSELIDNLETSDPSLKAEIVVKIAILAEKFSNNKLQWYINTMLQVILLAGDHVAETVWYRIVLIVTNHPEIHVYAAEKLFKAVSNKVTHEIAVALAAYLLGEIGIHICEKSGMDGFSQFSALHQHYPHVSQKIQSILLTCYIKLLNLYTAELEEDIIGVLNKQATSSVLEIQQRSCEYLSLRNNVNKEIMEEVLNNMPAFPIEKENSLLALMENEKKEVKKPLVSKSAPVAPVDKTPSPTNSNEVDLLSMDNDADFASSGEVFGIPEGTKKFLKGWFNSSITAASGQRSLLYEDDVIKISVTGEFRAHQGRMSLFFQNLSDKPITNFAVTIPTMDYLAVQTQNSPPTINNGQETCMKIMANCILPFADVPQLEVSFTSGSPRVYALRLPILASCYFEPITINKEGYMARWKSLEADKTEVQEIFQSPKPIDADLLTHIRTNLFQSLHIAPSEGLDGPMTATGCCSLRYANPEGGAPLVYGTLLRIEGDANKKVFRITVRSKHATVSSAVRNIFKGHLA
jgi:AP-2 complex subunit alpha